MNTDLLLCSQTAVHALIIRADDGRELLHIDLAAGTVTGELEDLGEAAEKFVEFVRARIQAGA